MHPSNKLFTELRISFSHSKMYRVVGSWNETGATLDATLSSYHPPRSPAVRDTEYRLGDTGSESKLPATIRLPRVFGETLKFLKGDPATEYD